MKFHDFWEKLAMGNKWEGPILETMTGFLYTEQIRLIKYRDSKEETQLQLEGIDGILYRREITFDTKVRENSAHKYKDILVETRHECIRTGEFKETGWYSKCTADAIVYMWENKTKNALIDGYLILIQNPKLRKWFNTNHTKYPERIARTKTTSPYRTINRAIPISEFPQGTIFRLPPINPIKSTQQTLF